MKATAMVDIMSPKLLEVRERAKRDPRKRFMSLAHLIDEVTLRRAYDGIRALCRFFVQRIRRKIQSHHGERFVEPLTQARCGAVLAIRVGESALRRSQVSLRRLTPS